MSARESRGGHRVPKTLPDFQQHLKVLVVGAVEVMSRRASEKWGGRDPNLMDGRPPTHRGGHGRGMLAGRLR
jgi:hypothetical protein